MTFLPIVERELRVRSRLKSTWRFRMAGAVLAMVVVGFMLMVSSGMSSPAQLGKSTFQALAWLAFIYCLLEGIRNTADCLTEEKRGGTLGFLFLTDLTGYDVVLGKLMATSLNSFYALLAVLPLIATTLLLGGVTAGEFWRLAAVLVVTLFFSLAIGLFVSAVSRDERRAWGRSLGLVFLLTFYPLVAQGLSFLPRGPLVLLSPTLAFGSLADADYSAGPGLFWSATMGTAILSGGLLVLASIILPHAWQEGVAGREQNILSKWEWMWMRPGPERERKECLQLNPVGWLAERGGQQEFVLWVVVGMAVVLGVTSYGVNYRSKGIAEVLFWCALGFHFLLAVWAGAQASFVFGDARSSGALELLLATPLSVQEIVRGHFQALRKLFYRPVLVLLAAEGGLLAVHLFRTGSGSTTLLECLAMVMLCGVAMLVFVLDLFAAGWFGLWMGLKSKKPGQALTKTILFVLVLPLVCGSPCNILWPILGLVKDLIFINYAQDQLYWRFRAIVTEQFSTRVELERWLGGDSQAAPPRLPPVIP